VILAQILLLTLLAFAPVALLIAVFPGRGHAFFRAWLGKLAVYLARKVICSLIFAIILAACQALDDAASNLGCLLAFSLQAAFLGTIFPASKSGPLVEYACHLNSASVSGSVLVPVTAGRWSSPAR
jgi:hypothetical protein